MNNGKVITELFTLCDYADNDNGRLTIVKTMDSIKVDKLPWRVYIGIAFKGLLKGYDYHNKDFVLRIFSPNGEELFSAKNPLGQKTIDRLVMAGNIKGLVLKETGIHLAKCFVGDDVVAEYPVAVSLSN